MSADPTTWGPQTNGFGCPTVQDLIDKIQTDQRSYIDPEYDTDPDSPEGQNVAIFARQLALAWEALRALDAAQSRDGAEGDMLVQLGKMTGSVKGGPVTTKVLATCTLTAGTFLEAGVSQAHLFGHPDILFTPVADFTAPTSDAHVVAFECTETGPIACPLGTLTVIATPTTGWTGVVNWVAGVTGSDGDTDAQFRTAQVDDLTRAGSNTAAAIAQDIEEVAGVIQCTCLENYTDVIDSNGLPGKSIEVVVYTDGTVVTADLGLAIWQAKPAGIVTVGSSTATFIDPVDGTTRTVKYSVVADRPVYLSYVITKTTGYVGDDQVKATVVEKMTQLSGAGVAVKHLAAQYAPMGLGGITDVPTCRLGLTASPTGETNLTMTARERASFATSRVSVSYT